HEPGTPAFFRIYDAMRRQNEPDAFVEEMLSPAHFAGNKVLDVGCGNGYILSKFAMAGAEAHGIDLTGAALDLTRKRIRSAGLRAELLQADSARLPFADSSFDLVYSLGVLHHSPRTHESFREIHRVLRPGGKAVIMIYNRNSVLFRLRIPAMKYLNPRFRGWSIQELCNYLDGPGNPLGKFFSRKEITLMMDGFRDLRFRPYFFSHLHFPGKPDIFPEGLCQWIGRRFGWFLYVSAYKEGASPCAASPAS
ncbi:MAG: class I SAM-dependent methyltransferase, partial [Deltaproteobacteria bacterium]|nr:class I SAM-dependent methyltransferase [Deltaproteobacteria bacterium]